MIAGVRRLPIGGMLLGLSVLGLGIFVAVGTWMMPEPAMASAVGPKDFPVLIASGLIIIGGLLLREAFVRKTEEEAVELDWRAIGLVLGALLVQLLLLGLLGWISATAFLFMMTARAFGSRRVWVDMLIGAALAGIIFVVFDYGLDLDLPLGSLAETLFE